MGGGGGECLKGWEFERVIMTRDCEIFVSGVKRLEFLKMKRGAGGG